MIVVVGIPAWRSLQPSGPAGRACGVAIAAAQAGASVELVGRAGDDGDGDALMVALAGAAVGHAAMLRDPSRPTPIINPPDPDDDTAAGTFPPHVTTPNETATSPAVHVPMLEAPDVSLGLRYLTDYRVLVVTDDVPDGIIPVAIEAAAFAGARLVILVPAAGSAPPTLPPDATVLSAPDEADDGAFAALVGAYAAALDAGAVPADAFAAATGGSGWEALDPRS